MRLVILLISLCLVFIALLPQSDGEALSETSEGEKSQLETEKTAALESFLGLKTLQRKRRWGSVKWTGEWKWSRDPEDPYTDCHLQMPGWTWNFYRKNC